MDIKGEQLELEHHATGDILMVATNPNDPYGSEVRFGVYELESTTPSKVSLMPEGLLNTLTADEVLDLLAYLLSDPLPKTPVP